MSKSNFYWRQSKYVQDPDPHWFGTMDPDPQHCRKIYFSQQGPDT